MIAAVNVNLAAVAVSAVACMILGMIWYGPLFGKKWSKLTGMKQEDMGGGKKEMPKAAAAGLITAAVSAYVLGAFIKMVGATGAVEGAAVGAMAWLGFVASYQ